MFRNKSESPCPACRTPNKTNARFCLNCGKPLTTAEKTPYQPPTSHHAPPMSADFIFAGFWKRFFAYWIDGIVFGIIFLLFAISGVGWKTMGAGELTQVSILYFGFYFGWWMYFALMESSSSQATLGKRALGIKVTDMQGYQLSFMHAAGRQLAGVISSFTFTIGYLIAAFSGRKQALHDMIAGTVVVNKNFGANQIQQVNQSPPPGMSFGSIFGVIVLVLIIPVGGILAAIAIPAYNQYQVKALVFEAYEHASEAKVAIVKQATETGYWPVNFEQASLESESMRREDYYIKLQQNGVLEIHFSQPQQISNSILRLIPDIANDGNYVWDCQTMEMDTNYSPPDCQSL